MTTPVCKARAPERETFRRVGAGLAMLVFVGPVAAEPTGPWLSSTWKAAPVAQDRGEKTPAISEPAFAEMDAPEAAPASPVPAGPTVAAAVDPAPVEPVRRTGLTSPVELPAWFKAIRAVPASLGPAAATLSPPGSDPQPFPRPEAPEPTLPLPPLVDIPLLQPALPANSDARPTADAIRSAWRAQVLAARGLADPAKLTAAIAAYRSGDLDAGDAQAATFKDPAVRALLEWLALRRGAQPFERVITFLDMRPEWPSAPALRRRAEERLIADAVPAARVRAFFQSKAPVTGAGKIALACALQRAGLDGEAADLVRDAWRRDGLSLELESRVLKTFAGVLTTSDHAARMERQLFRGNRTAAMRAANLAGPAYAALGRARIAVATGLRSAAIMLDALPDAVKDSPSAIFGRAQLLRKDGRLIEAVRVIENVTRDPKLLVDGDGWWAERRALSRALLEMDVPAAAYQVAARHGAESAADRIEAEFSAGWIALRELGDPAAALIHFTAASKLAQTPISTARAEYWRGRAAEAGGRTDVAEAAYRAAAQRGTAYYGQLARGRIGAPEAALRPTPDADVKAQIVFGARPAAQALELLEAIGERDLALILFRDFAQQLDSEGELSALAGLARRSGDAAALLAVGKTALQRGYSLEADAFPSFGVPVATARPLVDQAMVLAIARQESAFDIDAMSPAGAMGLMQMMPATARATARQVGIPYDQARMTRDARYNADLGAAHLSDLMRNWKGSPILTFAAYNAGGGNVTKWIRAYGDPRRPDIDPIDWVERIPFGETRNYVQRVLENLQVYRHQFDARPVRLSEADMKGLRRAP